jgi:NAD(P)-dependent dehydrogenase (short-subunit alcohol dehydrogenase family)
MSLQGKYALITGSSRGLGRGIALKLAEKGVKVAVNYRQNEAGTPKNSKRRIFLTRRKNSGVPGRLPDRPVEIEVGEPCFALSRSL